MLVVDDDASLRLLCRVNLELDGYQRARGAERRGGRGRSVAADLVDLFLLDVHIGADDRLALMRSLREREHAAPVVLFTGSARARPRHDRDEADGVVPKPFRLEQLLDVVRALAPHR